MALTRYIEEQIENAAIRGIPFTATPGQFLALGRANYADRTLVVLDFTRVNLPTFVSSINRRFNSSTITITNDTSFRETCDQLIVMSADNNPLLVMELPAYIALNPGESLVLPPFSVNIREYDDLDNQSGNDIASNVVYDTTVLPYRAITNLSNLGLQGSVVASPTVRVTGISNTTLDLATAAAASVSVSASAFSNAVVTGGSNGTSSVVLGSEIDSIDWEEGFDLTTLNSIDYNSYSTFGNPAHSPDAGTATFSADPGAVTDVAAASGQSTSPLLASGIGSARTDLAYTISDNLGLVMNDGPNSAAIPLSTTGPLHFRWLVTFPQDTGTGTGNRVLHLFRDSYVPAYRTWELRARIWWDDVNSERLVTASTSYRPTDNVNFTSENLNVSSDITSVVSDGDWVLIDVVVRENGSGNLQLEVMANGETSSLDSSNSFSGPFEISQKDIAQFGTLDNESNMLFFGYRRSDYTLAEHNAALTALGI